MCARCEAILSKPSKGSLSVHLSSNRKHVMTEGSTNASHHTCSQMLTEAECYCAKLSRAIFSQHAVITVRTADMQQSINVHLCTPRHPNPSMGTAWHTHRTTRIDVLQRQTTHGHTRTNTRKPTGNGWPGGWSGQNRNYWKISHIYVFPEKVLNST